MKEKEEEETTLECSDGDKDYDDNETGRTGGAAATTWWRCQVTHQPLLLLLALPLSILKRHVEGPMDLLEQEEQEEQEKEQEEKKWVSRVMSLAQSMHLGLTWDV